MPPEKHSSRLIIPKPSDELSFDVVPQFVAPMQLVLGFFIGLRKARQIG